MVEEERVEDKLSEEPAAADHRISTVPLTYIWWNQPFTALTLLWRRRSRLELPPLPVAAAPWPLLAERRAGE
jgi:hypothetical protein